MSSAIVRDISTGLSLSARASLLTTVSRGTLSICGDDSSFCRVVSTTEPERFPLSSDAAALLTNPLPSSRGHLWFVPELDTFAQNYSWFEVKYTNAQNTSESFRFTINVTPVNDPPFLLSTFPIDGLVIFEGDQLPLSWSAAGSFWCLLFPCYSHARFQM